jgi:hypothetical protein
LLWPWCRLSVWGGATTTEAACIRDRDGRVESQDPPVPSLFQRSSSAKEIVFGVRPLPWKSAELGEPPRRVPTSQASSESRLASEVQGRASRATLLGATGHWPFRLSPSRSWDSLCRALPVCVRVPIGRMRSPRAEVSVGPPQPHDAPSPASVRRWLDIISPVVGCGARRAPPPGA